MNSIIKNYKLQINNFQKIENDSNETEIHDKRVILRRIFPILEAYRIKPSKVKNGEKAFKLFGKLRDIQVQILKLESINQTAEILEYHAFLIKRELKLKVEVSKFCKKKELKFPTIKKVKVDKFKIYIKAEKAFNRLVSSVQLESIDDAEDIHKIRIQFKKFRYVIEVLACIQTIDESKLEKLKTYQDQLGEIQDYEVLITGIRKYYKKRKQDDGPNLDVFEKNQNELIESFDNELETFIEVCRDVIDNKQFVCEIKDLTGEIKSCKDV
jgi:CHAD domain-containing protein